MSWLPLPFPKCPSCGNSWEICYHRNCSLNGEVEVEIYLNKSRCSSCYSEWNLFSSQFYCSCGYSFSASEVQSALDKTIELKRKLEKMLREMHFTNSEIRNTTYNSFRSWLGKVSYGIGRTFGKIAKVIYDIFD